MKTLQESVNFILADESMRYVEQDGRVRETGTKLFYKYFSVLDALLVFVIVHKCAFIFQDSLLYF